MNRQHQHVTDNATFREPARVEPGESLFDGPSGYEQLPHLAAPSAARLTRRVIGRRRQKLVVALLLTLMFGGTLMWKQAKRLRLGQDAKLMAEWHPEPGSRAENASLRDQPALEVVPHSDLPAESVSDERWPYRVQMVWTALVPVVEENAKDEMSAIVDWQWLDYSLSINPEFFQENQHELMRQVLDQPTSYEGIEL